MILSTHLLELIEALADRILIMNRGEKLFGGTLAEARERVFADSGSSLEEVFMAATEGQGPEAAVRATLGPLAAAEVVAADEAVQATEPAQIGDAAERREPMLDSPAQPATEPVAQDD